MQCPSCKTTFTIEARFCPSCGAPLLPPAGGDADVGSRARPPAAEAARADPLDAETLGRTSRDPDELETVARPPSTAPGPFPRRAGALGPGREFGPYRLVKKLGQGGFGEVWEADSLKTDRRLALKVLTAAPTASDQEIERFKREGRLAASLSHPNCVYVFSAETIDGYPVITMELMPGGTLQDVLKKDGALSYRKAVDYALQIVDGLEAAAAAGVIHRDIKPSNCFLDPSGAVRIGDFGLSKSLEADSHLTATGSFLGTPAYSSPEQVKGRDIDSLSDLYSVGATLYALLTGQAPFVGDGGGQVLARILSEPPTPFSNHAAQVPKGLQRVVMRTLAKDKSRRYPGYAALRAALRPYSSRGLATGGQGARLAAVVLDFLLIHLAAASVAGAVVVYDAATLRNQLFLLVAMFVYFLLQEWLWGRTVGKHLVGLRVVTAGGDGPPVGPVVIRAGLFAGVLHTPLIVWIALHPGVPSQELPTHPSFWIICVLLPYAALLAPMRRRNGFAALHDLASGTRVSRVAAARRSAVPDLRAEEEAEATSSAEAFGPYREIRPLWQTGDEALRLARDPDLGRQVWIHSFRDDARAPQPSSLAWDRPGRLRWLQGARRERDRWDAYEAPSGIGLLEWVAARGRLPWGALREILLDLAVELDARLTHAETAVPLSVRHLWVDGHGQARLLDFPSHHREGEEVEGFVLEDWRHFLHQVLLLGCEGRRVDREQLLERTPRVPLPEYTRPLIQRICGVGQPLVSPAELATALRALAGKPASVSRRRRLGPLLTTMAPSLFMLFSLTLALLFAGESLHLARQLGRSHSALEIIRSQAQGPEREANARLLELLQADAYGRLKEASTSPSNPMSQRVAEGSLNGLEPEQREALERLLRDHPPGVEELAQGRRLLDVVKPPTRSMWGVALWVLLYFAIAPLAIPALILAPFLRGGALLALFGMRLQTLVGQPASRLRSFLRAAVAWAPFIVFRFWAPWVVLHVAFPLVLAIGCGWALARPERGIPDLIVRTQLVPR